jgi:hypothetical protein
MKEIVERVEDARHRIADAGRAAMRVSIDRILEYKPTAAYLTHYSVDLQA